MLDEMLWLKTETDENGVMHQTQTLTEAEQRHWMYSATAQVHAGFQTLYHTLYWEIYDTVEFPIGDTFWREDICAYLLYAAKFLVTRELDGNPHILKYSFEADPESGFRRIVKVKLRKEDTYDDDD